MTLTVNSAVRRQVLEHLSVFRVTLIRAASPIGVVLNLVYDCMMNSEVSYEHEPRSHWSSTSGYIPLNRNVRGITLGK